MSTSPREPSVGRTARKRRAILDAATSLFLRNGFRATSMDEVASLAGVSKQTVYKQFTDKEHLFREIIAGVTPEADAIAAILTTAFGEAPAASRDELEARLRRMARVYLDGVLRPEVLALRRLLISEAEQFPDLALDYYAQAPARGIDVVARLLAPHVDSGLLVADDLQLAAAHFAYLALGPAQDRALFIPAEPPSDEERDRLAAAAARAFVAAYGAAG